MIKFKHTGDLKKTEMFFKKASNINYKLILEKYGREGVKALSSATPKDSGETASSWRYKIENNRKTISIKWYNDNIVNGVPIAIILQYGHVTGTGGFVQGIDYINPVIQPIFDNISRELWKEVTRL